MYIRYQIDTYYDNKNGSFIIDLNHACNWLRIKEKENLDAVLREIGADITNEDHEGYAIRLMRKNSLQLFATDVEKSL